MLYIFKMPLILEIATNLFFVSNDEMCLIYSR